MRAPAAALALLLLPTYLFSQDHVTVPSPEKGSLASARKTGRALLPPLPRLALPGGASFIAKVDEMTDRAACAVYTSFALPKDMFSRESTGGVYAAFDGQTASVLMSDDLDVDYSMGALIRIGDAEAFRLEVPSRPHTIDVPRARTADFVGALYARERVRIRFSRWPGGREENLELAVGDFAAGYDFAIELCGWPRPSLPRVQLPLEPVVEHTESGGTEARFGGDSRHSWSAGYFPSSHGCSVAGPVGFGSVVMVIAPFGATYGLGGTLKFYTARGKLVGSMELGPRTPAPVSTLTRLAGEAGDDGMVESYGGLFSLYGLRAAVRFAEKTCGLILY